MKLRLQTDYALRALIYLGHAGQKSTAEEVANAFDVSKDHLVKVLQQLSRMGYVRTYPGRGGGIAIARDPTEITVREVIESMEGNVGVLECVQDSSVCPMEPGCHLRRLLMSAELAFYEALGSTSIADLYRGRRKGGLVNLDINFGGG